MGAPVDEPQRVGMGAFRFGRILVGAWFLCPRAGDGEPDCPLMGYRESIKLVIVLL